MTPSRVAALTGVCLLLTTNALCDSKADGPKARPESAAKKQLETSARLVGVREPEGHNQDVANQAILDADAFVEGTIWGHAPGVNLLPNFSGQIHSPADDTKNFLPSTLDRTGDQFLFLLVELLNSLGLGRNDKGGICRLTRKPIELNNILAPLFRAIVFDKKLKKFAARKQAKNIALKARAAKNAKEQAKDTRRAAKDTKKVASGSSASQ